jgi:hypothetical protein
MGLLNTLQTTSPLFTPGMIPCARIPLCTTLRSFWHPWIHPSPSATLGLRCMCMMARVDSYREQFLFVSFTKRSSFSMNLESADSPPTL